MSDRFNNIAEFTCKKCCNVSTKSNTGIRRIARKVFGHGSLTDIIKRSLEFYDINNIDLSVETIDDPIERKLLDTEMYRQYKCTMQSTDVIGIRFYDMRGCEAAAKLPEMLIDWTRRRCGVCYSTAV